MINFQHFFYIFEKFGVVRVQKYGLSGRTEADGLACTSPFDFVTRIMTPHPAGIFTVNDCSLYKYLRMLCHTEGIEIEQKKPTHRKLLDVPSEIWYTINIRNRRYFQTILSDHPNTEENMYETCKNHF